MYVFVISTLNLLIDNWDYFTLYSKVGLVGCQLTLDK